VKNTYTENELSAEALNELSQLCGGGYRQVAKFQDDFGDTSWLDEFVEDFLQG
jgi:hypothetical protein